MGWAILLLTAGLLLLWKGADLLVTGAVGIAERLGVSQLVVGLTVVAMGTSAPEAAASIASVLDGRGDIAIGNTYYIGQMLADPEQRAAAEAVRIVYPTFTDSGTHMNISGMAMTKSAPNRAEALQFMEFLAGDTAQKIYAEINNEFPVKPGVPVSDLVASWGSFTPDTLPLAEIATQRPAALKLMEEINFDG